MRSRTPRFVCRTVARAAALLLLAACRQQWPPPPPVPGQPMTFAQKHYQDLQQQQQWRDQRFR
jgi:outer membrane biogenesis lipoprotein LolB